LINNEDISLYMLNPGRSREEFAQADRCQKKEISVFFVPSTKHRSRWQKTSRSSVKLPDTLFPRIFPMRNSGSFAVTAEHIRPASSAAARKSGRPVSAARMKSQNASYARLAKF
jgi:hypothetical protein